jgi:cbb3-type cytochrome oxidase maturation protein
MWSIFLLIFLMLCAGFAGWLFFLWAVKSGQYDDIEGPKYRMLDDEEDDADSNKKDVDKPRQP